MLPFDYTIDQKIDIIKKYIENQKEQKLYSYWFDASTGDSWRHNRMYEIADCLKHLDYKWLTIGDGRFGLDSLRLKRKGIKNIMPTDIKQNLLDAAQKEGWIESYSVENAEKLSFDDNSFDVIFCKESYHHFPHPQIGLYEMIRVAKEAVILIEPNDPFITNSIPFIIKQKIKNIIKRKYIPYAGFEPEGNYIYSISKREMEKIGIVQNMNSVAFKGLNDYYIKGIEFEPADRKKSKIFDKTCKMISKMDKQCKLGFADYGLLMAALFKNPIDDNTKKLLIDNNWTIVELPKNPYI
ncbi:MAG: class I SAM-dependent methyltransferase [Armatimonadota bacterium]